MKTIKDLYEAYIGLLKPKASKAKANRVLEELGEMPLSNLMGSLLKKYGDDGLLLQYRYYIYNAFKVKTNGRTFTVPLANDEMVRENIFELQEWLNTLCSMISKVARSTCDEKLKDMGDNILTYAQDVAKRKNQECAETAQKEFELLKKETEELCADQINARIKHENILAEIEERKHNFDRNIDKGIHWVTDALNEVYREVEYIFAHKSLRSGMWNKPNKEMVQWCAFLRKQTWAIAQLTKSAEEKDKMDKELGLSDRVELDNSRDRADSVGITFEQDEEKTPHRKECVAFEESADGRVRVYNRPDVFECDEYEE